MNKNNLMISQGELLRDIYEILGLLAIFGIGKYIIKLGTY